MAIQHEIWIADIVEKLFPKNDFMMQSVDDSAWVNFKTVHRPNAGALPEVQRNRTVFPAPLVKRTDVDNSYLISEFTSTPSLIQDIEETETNYGKRQSVTTTHGQEINKQIANWMAYFWGATSSAVMQRTTGAARAANTPGATGNRKIFTLNDLLKIRQMFDDQDLSEEGRNILLPSHFYNDLIENEKDIMLSKDFRNDASIKDGVIEKLMGFKIYKRGRKNVLRYTNDGTPVLITPDTAAAATDNAGALVWHKDCVARAQGAVKVFEDTDKPEYYGSVFSALARAGGQKLFADGTGVAAIIEDVAA